MTLDRTTVFYRNWPGYVSAEVSEPQRILSVPISPFKPYVDATPGLTANQQNVSKAYLALMGRSPDSGGLTYWASQPAAATLAGAVDMIAAAISPSLVYDPDPGVSAAMLYHHLMGKTEVEDPSGIGFWAGQITNTSIGQVTAQIVGILTTATGYTADLMRYRMYTLESVCRLQYAYSRDLNIDDAHAAITRVDGTGASYDAAMADIYTLLVAGGSNPSNAFDTAWTSSSLAAAAIATANTSILQVRNLVWYNRAGRMMQAVVYLPPNFTTGSHRAIVLWHGGGWRLNWPQRMEWFANELAAATGQTYIVICPSYRLTALGTIAPGQEQDAEDILALVRANSSVFRCDASRVGLAGESSGGHLAGLLGSTQDAWRVFALYPPMDLTGTPAVSSGLDPYVNWYATTSPSKANSSPQVRWTSARTTKFKLWHGTADTFVPPSQSTNFDTLVGANCDVQLVTGEGHGFGSTARASAISDAKAFFALA